MRLVLALLALLVAHPATAGLGILFQFECIDPTSREQIVPGGLALCVGFIGNELDGEDVSFDAIDARCFYPDGTSDPFDEDPLTKGLPETVPQHEKGIRFSVIQARLDATGELACAVHTIGRRIELSSMPAFEGTWGIGVAVLAPPDGFPARAAHPQLFVPRVPGVRRAPRCGRRLRETLRFSGAQLVGRPTPSGRLKLCRLA